MDELQAESVRNSVSSYTILNNNIQQRQRLGEEFDLENAQDHLEPLQKDDFEKKEI